MAVYSIEDIKQAINKANSEDVAVVFPGLFPDVPTWESFIMLIEDEIHNTGRSIVPQSPFKERAINGVIIRNLFYLTVNISSDESIKEMQPLKSLFGEIFNTEIEPVAAFINIVGGETPGEAHRDSRETIFWQCQGDSEWTIYEEPEEEYYDTSKLKVKKKIGLKAGDVLYLRNRGMHSVENFGPRASIVFMPV
jgi:hypothetical protein